MENLDYKQDVAQTRVGSLGGSDGAILAKIAELGYVPKSAYKRISIMNGLIERDNITTLVMRFGDFVEQSIFDSLHSVDERYISNPLWVSGKYSKEGCKLICHPDICLFDDKNKILKIYEVKATKFDLKQTRATYINQLFIEWTIGNEIVKTKGEGWKVQLYLAHYNTSGANIEEGFTFDPQRLSIHRVRIDGNVFDIDKAMNIVSEFASTFDYYTEDEEIDSLYLPEKVKDEFNTITTFLAEIKEREVKVEEFKRRLCDFMLKNNLKSIKNEAWNITLVNATESVSFDGRRYLAELGKKHPRVATKLRKQYEKRIAKSAYVTIKLKTNKEDK